MSLVEAWRFSRARGEDGTWSIPIITSDSILAAFRAVVELAGVWSPKRRPWKGGKERVAVVKVFCVISLPFVVLEAATGMVSFLTGSLSIPPLIGLGMAANLAILLAGIGLAAVWQRSSSRGSKSLADSQPTDEKTPPS